jgi:hypothetical protein
MRLNAFLAGGITSSDLAAAALLFVVVGSPPVSASFLTLLDLDARVLREGDDDLLLVAPVRRSTTLLSRYARVSMFLSLMTLYRSVCSFVMGAYKTYSRFLGRYLATSDFTLRRSRGCSTTCIFLTSSCLVLSAMNSSVPSSSCRSLKSNQLSNASQSRKILGSKKFSSDHSSLRLFCKGVPVMRRRVADVNVLSSRKSFESKFFMRWPSSMMMNSQLIFDRAARSLRTIS